MPHIKVQNTGQILECEYGENLLHVLVSHHIFIENPCNGKGNCKKCKVRIRKEGKEKEVLSCLTKVEEDMEIRLIGKEKKNRILEDGMLPEFEKDLQEGYGAAIDLGTTTIVCSLIQLSRGKEIASVSRINAQKRFGTDVLTRITYEYENKEEGTQSIRNVTIDCLNEMLEEVCKKAKVSTEELQEIDVAANCTMMHMFLGIDARSMGKSPYKPQFTGAKRMLASKAGLIGSENTVLYCLPHVSAFIGADIVAGICVCGLKKRKETTLFLDIGTNGEMVLFTKGNMYACSCAAGPALEGMNISSGMRAQDGAIEKIYITEKGIQIETIGKCQAEGICGSGILSITKELLRSGMLKRSGVFIKKDSLDQNDYRYDLLRENGKKREFILQKCPEILVTQKDIRQVQLAKGALLSGFTILLRKAGIKIQDLEQILIAGQFGSHLSKELLIGTGILPKEAKQKILYIGNTSKTGAMMALLSQKVKQEMEEIVQDIHYVELAETEQYERIFAESLIFPDEN